MRVRELAQRLGSEFEGDGEVEISGLAPIESAGPSDLSFINSRKAALQAEASAAGCLIVPPDFAAAAAPQVNRAIIRAASPRTTFAHAIALLRPLRRPDSGIHPTAVVAASARVGN